MAAADVLLVELLKTDHSEINLPWTSERPVSLGLFGGEKASTHLLLFSAAIPAALAFLKSAIRARWIVLIIALASASKSA